MNSVVEMKHVTKRYGKIEVLKDVSLTCKAGKIYGLIGRNGSGKTVLLKSICGFVLPTSGEVRVQGQLVGKDVDFPTDIGFIIESPGFLARESGLQNLMHLASIREKASAEDVRQSMYTVGLDPDLRKPVGKYSMGMRQRLGIAQAIMENPNILILDEPMNGLDNQGVTDIRQVLKQLTGYYPAIFLSGNDGPGNCGIPPHRSSDGQQTPNRHFEGTAQDFREGGIRMAGTIRPSIPVQTILKAVNGETEALDAVLRHYSSYIRVLSTRPVKDTYGNEFLCVDESMRDQLEAKLRVSIVTAFKVLPV